MDNTSFDFSSIPMYIRYRMLSAAFALHCFRNTVLEDYHAGDGTPMSMDIFEEMKRVVSENVEKYSSEFWKLLVDCDFSENRSDPHTLSYDALSISMFWAEIVRVTKEWYQPKMLHRKLREGMTVSDYVLDGEFKEACMNGVIITDKEMPTIVHDVHCRFYTLIRKGVFTPSENKEEKKYA